MQWIYNSCGQPAKRAEPNTPHSRQRDGQDGGHHSEEIFCHWNAAETKYMRSCHDTEVSLFRCKVRMNSYIWYNIRVLLLISATWVFAFISFPKSKGMNRTTVVRVWEVLTIPQLKLYMQWLLRHPGHRLERKNIR